VRRTVLYIQGVARYGGAPESLYRLTTRLTRYRPLVATSRKGELTRRLDQSGVEFFTVRMGMWRKAKTWPRLPITLLHLYRRSRKEKVALIHCNTLWDSPYGVTLGRLLGVPVVTHVRNTFEREKIEKYMLDRVNMVLAVSRAVADPLREWGIPYQVVYNGVDLEVFSRKALSGEGVRRELGVGEAPLLLLPGRVDTTKGQREAIMAMKTVVKEVPQAVLVVVGETSRQEEGLTEELKALASRLGVGERVIFPGARKDMPAFYAAADVVIMPSLESAREGFGRVLIEAMAMGKATVATRTGGIPEVMMEGETGLLVPPGDVEALARAVVDLLRDEEKRKRMGERGYERVKRFFDLEKTVVQVEEVYEELLSP